MPKAAQRSKPTVEMWPPVNCIPYPGNARIIPDSAVEKVATSIREFGFRSPILVDGEGVIIAGHTRLLAAKRLKLKAVPVMKVTDLTPAQVRAYRLADNRTAQETTWDLVLLNVELENLSEMGELDLTVTGFDPDELAGLPLPWADDVGEPERIYTPVVNVPQYEPVGEQPEVTELRDESKADELRAEILTAGLEPELEAFLLAAAGRHTVFDYRKVAEFYPHAEPEVQHLIERSALVIVDYEDAIREGYVRLSNLVEQLRKQDTDG